jgi:adhesin/invasin
VVGVGQSASFQLTNVAASRGTITGVGGTTQIAQVNNSFAIPLTVAIQDSRGQPVIGTTVTFKSPSTGPSASLSQPTAWTDHQGRASISVAANEQTGSYQVTATAPGFQGTAGFNLQNSTILPTSPVITSIVNAASFVFGAAPGSLQTIFGMNLGAETAIATTNPLPLSLGGIRVLLKAKPVPLLYVSSSQINFQIPVDATAGASDLVVSSGSGPLASTSLRVDNTAPGVFLQLKGDSRRAAALNLDYSLNLPATPTPAGSYISVFLTGIGAVSPVVPSGDAAPISPLSTSSSATSATIGPRPVVIQYTGRAPQSLTDQVNLQVPVDLPPGEYPVIVTINGVRSNSAIISIGPAER